MLAEDEDDDITSIISERRDRDLSGASQDEEVAEQPELRRSTRVTAQPVRYPMDVVQFVNS